LALAIGANTAIFSLLDGVVLRGLPVPHPDQLVRFGAHVPGDDYAALSLPMFQELSRGQRVFSGTFAWWGDGVFNAEMDGRLADGGANAIRGHWGGDRSVALAALRANASRQSTAWNLGRRARRVAWEPRGDVARTGRPAGAPSTG